MASLRKKIIGWTVGLNWSEAADISEPGHCHQAPYLFWSLSWGNTLSARVHAQWNSLKPICLRVAYMFLLAHFLQVHWHRILVFGEVKMRKAWSSFAPHMHRLQRWIRNSTISRLPFSEFTSLLCLKIIHDVCVVCGFDWVSRKLRPRKLRPKT